MPKMVIGVVRINRPSTLVFEPSDGRRRHSFAGGLFPKVEIGHPDCARSRGLRLRFAPGD
jgi:hypothetical protein